jgi:hypothetical protein
MHPVWRAGGAVMQKPVTPNLQNTHAMFLSTQLGDQLLCRSVALLFASYLF